MRTLILSDLHFGNGGDYDIFAGGESLPVLLDRFVDPPTRVILNGDTMDFLLNEDPLGLSVAKAVQQAECIATAPSTVSTLRVLGRICAGGGKVLVKMGNHDVELVFAEVQEVFRNRLNQPRFVAQKMTFGRGDLPYVIPIGGVSILITHGEQNDFINRVDYDELSRLGASGPVFANDFQYSPGSLIVKEFLNPLKKKYHLRFADLLKPDVRGGILTMIAVDPGAAKIVLKEESLKIIHGVLKNLGSSTFEAVVDKTQLTARLKEAGLTEQEIALLKQLLYEMTPETFLDNIPVLLKSLRLKLIRAGLKLYAHAHRRIAADDGMHFFNYDPDESEMDEARQLANKYAARVVITGHSHAARWKEEKELLYANTGTWIWLMRLPDEKASDEDWTQFLHDLKEDPKLEFEKNSKKLERRFTSVLVEPRAEGGAIVCLQILEKSGELRTKYSATVAP